MKTLLVAPNLPNSIGAFRRLPLVEDDAHAIPQTGLGMFKTYVPAKYGGVLEITCSEPEAEVIVRYPKPTSAPLKNLANNVIQPGRKFTCPVRPGEFGWFFILVGKAGPSYRMSATFKEVGLARLGDTDDSDPMIPWNFWYFPNAKSKREYTAWGSSTLKPCQKYERAFGRSNVLKWEKHRHNDPTGTAGAWWGHCHNSAPASIIFKTPPPAGKTYNGVHFLCEELKFLATEFYGLQGTDEFIWGLPGTGPMGRGGFYQENKPSDDPRRFGKHIGVFHKYLIQHLLKGRRPLMMDLRDGSGADHSAVWNQAAYKYEARFFELPPYANWMELQVKTYLRANTDILKHDFSSSGQPARVVASGPRPGGKPTDTVPRGNRRDQTLKYRLVFRRNGVINDKHKRNRWYSITPERKSDELHAPRFIFKMKKPAGNPDPDGNVEIRPLDVLKLLELRRTYR